MSVMNVKRSTQAFSSAPQSPSAKSEGANTAGAEDFAKVFGDQAMGDVLNKIADPNWIDPSKKMRTTGDPSLDKDAFMKLMLTQMKHQDPTNPMQSHEMASQLAQFTSLEQLNNINATLEAMKTSQTPSTNFQALAFIGKRVSGDSSKVTRSAGDTTHAFNFELLGDASRANISVKDAAGNVVRKIELSGLKKGANGFSWNGLQDDGTPARPGEYKFVLEAQSNTGAKVHAKTSFEGRITGLNYTAQGPVLMVGGQTIKLSDVKKIEDPGMEEATPAIPLAPRDARVGGAQPTPVAAVAAPVKQTANVQPHATTSAAPEPEVIPPAEDPGPEAQGNIADVPMSRELQSSLQKEKVI